MKERREEKKGGERRKEVQRQEEGEGRKKGGERQRREGRKWGRDRFGNAGFAHPWSRKERCWRREINSGFPFSRYLLSSSLRLL